MAQVAHLSDPIGAVKSAFNRHELETGAVVVLGSFATSYVAGQLRGKVGVLNQNAITKVATTLLTAGLLAWLTKKAMPSRANEILLGGMISGVTEGLAELAPSTFHTMMGLGQGGQSYDVADENSLSFGLNDYWRPNQSVTMNGMDEFANPGRHMVMAGMDDFFNPHNGATGLVA